MESGDLHAPGELQYSQTLYGHDGTCGCWCTFPHIWLPLISNETLEFLMCVGICARQGTGIIDFGRLLYLVRDTDRRLSLAFIMLFLAAIMSSSPTPRPARAAAWR